MHWTLEYDVPNAVVVPVAQQISPEWQSAVPAQEIVVPPVQEFPVWHLAPAGRVVMQHDSPIWQVLVWVPELHGRPLDVEPSIASPAEPPAASPPSSTVSGPLSSPPPLLLLELPPELPPFEPLLENPLLEPPLLDPPFEEPPPPEPPPDPPWCCPPALKLVGEAPLHAAATEASATQQRPGSANRCMRASSSGK